MGFWPIRARVLSYLYYKYIYIYIYISSVPLTSFLVVYIDRMNTMFVFSVEPEFQSLPPLAKPDSRLKWRLASGEGGWNSCYLFSVSLWFPNSIRDRGKLFRWYQIEAKTLLSTSIQTELHRTSRTEDDSINMRSSFVGYARLKKLVYLINIFALVGCSPNFYPVSLKKKRKKKEGYTWSINRIAWHASWSLDRPKYLKVREMYNRLLTL